MSAADTPGWLSTSSGCANKGGRKFFAPLPASLSNNAAPVFDGDDDLEAAFTARAFAAETSASPISIRAPSGSLARLTAKGDPSAWAAAHHVKACGSVRPPGSRLHGTSCCQTGSRGYAAMQDRRQVCLLADPRQPSQDVFGGTHILRPIRGEHSSSSLTSPSDTSRHAHRFTYSSFPHIVCAKCFKQNPAAHFSCNSVLLIGPDTRLCRRFEASNAVQRRSPATARVMRRDKPATTGPPPGMLNA